MQSLSRFTRRALPVASSRRVMLVLMSLGTMYQFMYCTMLCSALRLLPVVGGAMFMATRVGEMLWRLLLGQNKKYLTGGMHTCFIVLSCLMLLVSLFLVALNPGILDSPQIWAVFTVVLLTSLRQWIMRRLVGRKLRRTISSRVFWPLAVLTHLSAIGLVSWPLFLSLPATSAWQMLGGFALGALLEVYGQWNSRDMIALEDLPDDIMPETAKEITAELKQVSAYSAYQRLHLLVLMALQVTLVLVYTFIGLTTDQLLTCMLLAVLCTMVMRMVADFCLRHITSPASGQMLLVGLFLWLYGLSLFYRNMTRVPNLTMSYIALCLSVSGLTVSVTALADLETRMTDVAQFKLQDQMQGYSQLRAASTEMAMALGQMIALLLLTLLCTPGGMLQSLDIQALAQALRPLMIVPPLILVGAAVLSVLRFPMNNRYFAKLAKWLTLKDEGKDNPALRQQLESVVVKRHKNRFGVKIIITLLRPLYYHKVIGKERLQGFEDGSMILICNHGELYGPVVANLYVPVTFRPWVIASMMEKEAIVEHIYQGTMVRQKWIPEAWKRPILRMLTPIMLWIFDSLEAIPVYRGKPRELMRTFRETIDAMQAGDNILLFPENGEDHEPGKGGYALEGVGQLYTGFAMIAPLYYAKTKKSAVFVPIYASRKDRTVTIGEGIQYDPKANANEEKMRIVNGLLGQMQAMYEKETGAQEA